MPCPKIILDAFFDREPDEDYPEIRHVPYYATAALHEYKSPPPTILPVALRLLRSPDPYCRMDGLLLVNSLTRGGTDSRKLLDSHPAAAKLVTKATRDPELEVRRMAIYSHDKLTGDTAGFLGNALRHQDDVAALPELPEDTGETEKRKRAAYNLGAIGVATMMATRIQESPREYRDGVLKLLQAATSESGD